MGLLELIIVLVVIGVIMFLVNKYIPMESNIRTILNVVVAVVVVVWLLSLFGILPSLNSIRVGR